MRIAFFTETFLPKIDGIVNTLCQLLDHLARRGHASLVFAPAGGPRRYAKTPVIGLPGYPFPLYPELKLVPPYIDVFNLLKTFNADVIHLVNPISLGLAGLRHARQLGLPVVASYHTDIPGFVERWGFELFNEPVWTYLRWVHNQADLNLCPSRATLDELQAHEFERLKVWSRGVDTALFHPQQRTTDWRARLSGGRPDAPLLLFVGRLSPEKRVDWLRPALAAQPQARLAIVGDGPARPELERRLADTPTVFTGYLRGQDLARAYAAADIFVFPAANETFGNVILEAMASQLPVVTPAAGGPLDFVTDNETGLLFAAADQTALVKAVGRLIDDPLLARRLGKEARRRAEARSWPAVLDGLLEDYAGLMPAYQWQQAA
ncbi:MAG: glycosyltransferase family 1 protein [Chloroflexota bacterium]